MANQRRLIELGTAPALAKELAAQINSGVSNKFRLLQLGMVAPLAVEVAKQITTKVVSYRRLIELSMVPQLAKEVVSQIQGGGGSPIVPPYPAPSGYQWAFVVENGSSNRVVENGNRVIELVRAA